jgi:hypothetical protein
VTEPDTPCGWREPHRAHRAWTTPEVGICPGVPHRADEQDQAPDGERTETGR